jgi:hypothetical protein
VPFFIAVAVLVLGLARTGRAVDLPVLVDQALEPVVTAAVAVAQGDRATASARAASVAGLVATAVAASEDPAVASALGRKARGFRRGLMRLKNAATRAGTIIARGRPATAAMRALKKASRAGAKVVRLLATSDVPGIVVVEKSLRAAAFYHPGQTVTFDTWGRVDDGGPCLGPRTATVVNLFGATAVHPTPVDLGNGRFQVIMASTGGAARVEVSGCGRTASPGRVVFNDGPSGTDGGDTWTLEEIMAGSGVGLYPQIALDAGGGPHVVSVNLATDAYEYSTRSGGSWTTETVSTAAQACGSNVGVLSDIAIDGAGVPHLSLEVPDQAVQHGVRGAGGWTVADVSTTLCPFSGVAVDQAYAFVGDNAIAGDRLTDTVWIVGWFYDGLAGQRAVAAWRTDASAMTLVDEGTEAGDTSTGRHPGVAVDGAGGVHVVYEGYLGGSVLRYARWNGAGFDASTVDSGSGNSGKSTAIATGTDNRPHLVYYRGGEGLRHAVWNGAGWDPEVVNSDTAAAGNAWIDLAIDGSDTLHVAYATVSGALRYVRGRWGSWSAPVTIIGDGDHPAIAVTTDGAPRVVFRDATGDRLYYATR